jgi:hypothetical protein
VHGGYLRHKVWYGYGRLESVGFGVVGFGMTRIEAEVVVSVWERVLHVKTNVF